MGFNIVRKYFHGYCNISDLQFGTLYIEFKTNINNCNHDIFKILEIIPYFIQGF